MVSINVSVTAINIHTESKWEHGAAELEKHKVELIVNTDGWKVDNRLSINGIHHKRINHQQDFADGRTHINGLDSCRGYGERRLSAYNVGFIRNDRLFIREISEKYQRIIRERQLRFSHRATTTVSTTCGIRRPTGPIRLHDALDFY